MEAKDTVMSEEQLSSVSLDGCAEGNEWRAALKVQAEISFKAGMKEVVDFVKAHTCNLEDWTGWQEQLEEWGLE